MNLKNENAILFFGTPDFAAVSLKALIDAGEFVAGVVTQPDKQKGRGMKVAFSAVKELALSQDIPVYQPETLKNGAISDLLQEINPSLIIVVAYGKIMPDYVLQYPKYGCINVHGSLLPHYRGAAPIQRAVMNGEAETGITTMLMDSGIDTGDMLLTQRTSIGENETTGELFDRLADIGGKLLVKTVNLLREGGITPKKQNHEKATFADKITDADQCIDWNENAATVHNRIRGLAPFPGADTLKDGKVMKLYASSIGQKQGNPGEVLALEKDGITIGCGTGSVKIASFKPEGKGVLTANDLINGRKIALGDILGR